MPLVPILVTGTGAFVAAAVVSSRRWKCQTQLRLRQGGTLAETVKGTLEYALSGTGHCRGWALFGVLLVGATISTLAPTIKMRRVRPAFRLAMIAFFCLIGGQGIFLGFYLSHQPSH